jgi:hypothetical protein
VLCFAVCLLGLSCLCAFSILLFTLDLYRSISLPFCHFLPSHHELEGSVRGFAIADPPSSPSAACMSAVLMFSLFLFLLAVMD